jgi:hypothetical protein
VLDRIVVDVIKVPRKVGFIANRMLPESPLPKRTFIAAVSLGGHPLGDNLVGKQALNSPPSSRKVRIAFRQRHDCVQMVREYNNRIRLEGPLGACDAKGMAQNSNLLDQQ